MYLIEKLRIFTNALTGLLRKPENTIKKLNIIHLNDISTFSIALRLVIGNK